MKDCIEYVYEPNIMRYIEIYVITDRLYSRNLNWPLCQEHQIPEIDKFQVIHLMGHLKIFYVAKVLFTYEKDLWRERI